MLDCFVIIRVSELSNNDIELIDNSISKLLDNYYQGDTITDMINTIAIVCVDHVTPTFQKIVNGGVSQGYNRGRLNVGISFGGKTIYIAKQYKGFSLKPYRRLRRLFTEIMKLS